MIIDTAKAWVCVAHARGGLESHPMLEWIRHTAKKLAVGERTEAEIFAVSTSMEDAQEYIREFKAVRRHHAEKARPPRTHEEAEQEAGP